MVKSKTVLDYQTSGSPRRISVPALIAFASLLTAVLYSLLFASASDAPLRHIGQPPASLAAMQSRLDVTDNAIAKAADGHNVLMHFLLSPQQQKNGGNFFSTLYFSSVYALYPKRVYLGNDQEIINNGQQLFAADQLPSDAWLIQHDVPATFSVLVDKNGPQALIHRVKH